MILYRPQNWLCPIFAYMTHLAQKQLTSTLQTMYNTLEAYTQSTEKRKQN